jgi:serine protease Do
LDTQELVTLTFNEASFTDGKISAKKFLDGSPLLQISAPITHGNSGGPVINSKGEVIGISTFYMIDYNANPFGQQVSGFAFIVPSNTIRDFLQQAGALNNEGRVTKSYREGLTLYSLNLCRQAQQKFLEVQKLFPQHPTVEKFINKCSD